MRDENIINLKFEEVQYSKYFILSDSFLNDTVSTFAHILHSVVSDHASLHAVLLQIYNFLA